MSHEEKRRQCEEILRRWRALEAELARPETLRDPEKLKKAGKQRKQLETIAKWAEECLRHIADMAETRSVAQDGDSELRRLAEETLTQSEEKYRLAAQKLEEALLASAAAQGGDGVTRCYVEIRAGTGGEEASLFVGDLMRMYLRYGERRGWETEMVSGTKSETGGFREVIMYFSGENVFREMSWESGTHRVQRVPATESQGRVHTSACTVAVLPEAEQIEEVELDREDLRIDTFRASGAGGQHVNKTDSAVRITHLPSGIAVECQQERSQQQNRIRALSLLKARLLAIKQEEQRKSTAETRRDLVGSGDRSEKIRTYNFPQGRVTEHRIKLTLHQLTDILDGSLELLIQPLLQHQKEKKIAEGLEKAV